MAEVSQQGDKAKGNSPLIRDGNPSYMFSHQQFAATISVQLSKLRKSNVVTDAKSHLVR